MSEKSAGMQAGTSESPLVPPGLREVLDASPDVLFACDAEGTLLWLNHAFELLTGRPASGQIGKPWSSAVAPQEVRRLVRMFLRQRRDRIPVVETPAPLLATGGREVWVTVRVNRIERVDGSVILVGTARAQAASDDGAATPDGRSAHACARGSSAGAAAAKPPGSAVASPASAQRHPRGLAAVLGILGRRRGPEPSAAPAAAPSTPAASSAPADAASNGTALKRQIEQLRGELEEARALARERREFLATMAHEIRTPMNGMIGMAHLLLETDLDSERRNMVEVLLQSGEVLLNLVNDTLDFSRVEAGKLELERIPFDLRVATNEVAALLAPMANEKGLELECVVHHEVPSRVMGDPGRLRQVLLNLGGNAVKFTDKGRVMIAVDRVREDEHAVTLRWAVADSGPGMSEDQKDRLFDFFAQGDNSIARRFGGTGLGLAISSRLVGLMGGTISLDSKPGEGSRFWFDVTLEKQADATQIPIPSPSKAVLAGLRVLVVDGSATMRRSFTTKLEACGCRVESAEDADRALARLHEGVRANDPFRLTLIERELPGMNGEELGAAIRADGAHDGTLTVLVTSVGRRGDAARARARGFSAYLVKPLDWDGLAAALAEVLHVTATAAPGATPPLVTRHSMAEARRSRLRILLVEDSPVSQLVTEWTLRRLGYGMRTVGTVREGLVACAEEAFDLVLLDLQLPDGDGFELTRVLRSSEAPGRHLPIVAMTGSVEPGDREKCLAAGMDEYLPKPVDLGLLSRMVQALTESELAAEVPPVASVCASVRGEPDPDRIAVVVEDARLLHDLEAAEAGAAGTLGWGDGKQPAANPEPPRADASAAFAGTQAAALLARDEMSAPTPPSPVQAPDPAPCEASAAAGPPALSPGDIVPLAEWCGERDTSGTQPPIDHERLEQTCMGIDSLRETVINAFLTEVRPRLEKLSEALAGHDARRAEFEAHGLKGMCATLGAKPCAETFAELERMCRERTFEGVPRLMKQAHIEVTRTEHYLTGTDWTRKAA